MKRYKLLSALFAAIFLSIMATAYTLLEADKSLAKVEQVRGIYIFTSSTPVAETEYLGTVKKTNWSNKYQTEIEGAVKNALEEFPKTEGLIIRHKDNGSIQADCIKFK